MHAQISVSQQGQGIVVGLTGACLKEETLVSPSCADLLRYGAIYAWDFHVQNSELFLALPPPLALPQLLPPKGGTSSSQSCKA